MDESKLAELRSAIDAALDRYTGGEDGCPDLLAQAIRYSCLAPGKRLRPLLALLACQAVSNKWEPAIPVACAVEMIHVYSLIHDDLPAMDNDDLRRGLPTCHKKFDEATAILAGDSLQMLAIEVLCADMGAAAAECCRVLSRAAGRAQLVGGQADDLAAEGRFGDVVMADPANPLEHLKSIHRRKTGALITASLQLGAIAGNATPQQIECLKHYGKCIGLAFQIVDDCLDVESTSEQLGKMTRKDSELGKLTYPGLLGLEQSRTLAQEQIDEAIAALEPLRSLLPQQDSVSTPEQPKDFIAPLIDLARFVVSRKK
ncbi:MAG: polyprenyl synthetase family protein [Aureliella sp.]